MRPSFNFLRAKDWKPLDFEGGCDTVCVAQDSLKLWIFPPATQLPQGLAPHHEGFLVFQHIQLSLWLAPWTMLFDLASEKSFPLWGRRTKGHLLRRQGHLGKHPGRTLNEGGRGWRTEDDLCSRMIWVILCTPFSPRVTQLVTGQRRLWSIYKQASDTDRRHVSLTCIIPLEGKFRPHGSQRLRKQLAIPSVCVNILAPGYQRHVLGIHT